MTAARAYKNDDQQDAPSAQDNGSWQPGGPDGAAATTRTDGSAHGDAAPSTREVDSLPIVISKFRHKADNVPVQERLTWGALRTRLQVHLRRADKDGPLFSPVSHKAGATRGKAGVDQVFLAVADIDNPEPDDKHKGVADEDVVTPEQFLAKYPPDLEVLIVSTHRSTPARPKFRAITPLATPCSGQDWGEGGIWRRIEAHVWKPALGAASQDALDQACKNADRFYYVPSCPPGAEPFVRYRPGRALDWTALPPVPEAHPSRVTRGAASFGVVENGGGGRPGDELNAKADWADILEPHGWVLAGEAGDEQRWRRPGKDEGWSATTDYQGSGLLYVFSSSAEPFEPEQSYSKFAAFAMLNHRGDFRAAAADVAARGWRRDSGRDSFWVVDNPMSKKEYKPRDPGDAGLYSSQPRVNPEEETANPSRPRGLVFRTASEIVANAVEPDWVLDGYLARGAVTLLSAREKVGKTTLALAALRAIQAGTPFMGRETMRTGVVYLSEETGATLPEKLARFELGDEGLVWLTRDMTGGISDFRDVMAAVVEEAARRGAGMVVVDTLAYWAGLKDDDENSSGAMLTAFRPILDAASAGLCVLVIHHNARQSGEYRGSTAIGGVVDVILSLTEDEAHGARRNLKARSRFGATPARLRVELQGNSFVSLGDPAAVAHRDCEDAVVEAIAASGLVTDPKTGERVKVTRDILIQQTGLSEFKVQGYLRSLEASGRVTKIGTGKRGAPFVYELAAEEAARRTARSATGAADTAIALSPREGTEAAAGLEQQVLEVIERTTTTISKARIAEILGLADPVVEGAIVVLEARGQISDPYHNRRHLRRVTDDDEGY